MSALWWTSGGVTPTARTTVEFDQAFDSHARESPRLAAADVEPAGQVSHGLGQSAVGVAYPSDDKFPAQVVMAYLLRGCLFGLQQVRQGVVGSVPGAERSGNFEAVPYAPPYRHTAGVDCRSEVRGNLYFPKFPAVATHWMATLVGPKAVHMWLASAPSC